MKNQFVTRLLPTLLTLALTINLTSAEEKIDNSYQGLWLTENAETVVRIFSCRTNSLCARVDGFTNYQTNNQQTSNEKIKALKTIKNVCSIDFLGGVKKYSAQWKKGWIIDFENKKKYLVNLELLNNDKLKLRVYKGIETFGETLFWKRIDKTPVSCTHFL